MENVKATFDLTTVEGQTKLFNAKNGASISLKKLEDGFTIEVVDVLQYPEKVDTYGNEQDAIVTCLFAKDGSLYAGISESIARAGESLIDFIKATGLKSFKVKLVKQKSSRNNEFLNLQIVS